MRRTLSFIAALVLACSAIAGPFAISGGGGGASVGGSNTQVQYNSSGSLAGDAGLVYIQASALLRGNGNTYGNNYYTPGDFQAVANWTSPASNDPNISFRGAMFGGSIGAGISANKVYAWSSINWGSSGDVNSNLDTGLSRTGAAAIAVGNGTAGDKTGTLTLKNLVTSGGFPVVTDAAAPTVASATTIAPTKYITFISGTTAIATITAPAPISSGGGCLVLIPTGLWTTTTGGNIALASTAVVSKSLTMCFDVTTTKWYPSY